MIAFDLETESLLEGELMALMPSFDRDKAIAKCNKTWKLETKEAHVDKLGQARAAAWRDKAALSPESGRVVAIGWGNSSSITIHGVDKKNHIDEADLLESWWLAAKQFLDRGTTMAGHNIFGFDLPFLVDRSRYLGLDVPPRIGQMLNGWERNPFLADTMRIHFHGERNKYVSLNRLAQLFGIEGKINDLTGAEFAAAWRDPKRHELAVLYLQQDVRVAREIACRLGVT